MPSNHLIFSHPLLLLPSIFPSIRVFSKESVLCIRWPTYWSFIFSISPCNVHSGLISFRMDWLDLLAVQETLRSLLQHHSSKASILWHSAFFMVQLSHPYLTGKNIALTRWTFTNKVMSLVFNMLTRLVIAFLPRSNCLLISCLQSSSAVILETKKIKSVDIMLSEIRPSQKTMLPLIWTERLCLWYIFMLKPNPQCGGVWRSDLWEMTVEPSWMGLVLLKKRTQKVPLPLTPSPLPLPPLRIQQKDSHLWTREQALIRWLVCWPLASLSWTSSLKNYKQSISVFITFSIYSILL